jgi:polysaccharide deacetylase family protein (PEP-CTERM system associated)
MTGTVCAFTIDVEGFAESHAQSVRVDPEYLDVNLMDEEITRNLDVTLELLAEFDTKATFFFLGRIAVSSPHLVRKVADAGHEIGCHSLEHLRITGQTAERFRADLRKAKAALENATGTSVVGFRAPDFSIGPDNLWAFDELVQAGFQYDSSVVSTSIHDVYGMPGDYDRIFQWPNGLVEFPMPTAKVLGAKIPAGGGGYFRLFPTSWTVRFFDARNRRNIPSAFYIHPYEIGPIAPRLPGLSFGRRLRHYIRLHKGVERLTPLLDKVPFTTMSRVLTEAGFLPPANRRS